MNVASALDIHGIRKVYGKGARQVEILNSIDIQVEPGEFLILVGPSGCGKSTLLNIIAGLDDPSAGEITIGGRSVARVAADGRVDSVAPKDRDIAMVFQSYALYPTMSVADNIGFALEMRKVPRPERERRIREVAQMLQMEHLLERRPSQLSGGQRQRVAMGRALARSPRPFLFDEPLSNLDAKLRVEMRAEIKRLHRASGITSVYVTHDQIEAMTLGSRIAIMKGGVLQQLGTPDEVYNRPANLFVAGFIGSPTMNLVAGTRSDAGFAVAGALLPLACPAPQAQLGLRPEHLSLDSNAAWRGEVSVVEPTGADTYVLVRTEAGDIMVRCAPQTAAQVGDQVGLQVRADAACWFDPHHGERIV